MKERKIKVVHTLPAFDEDGSITGTPGPVLVKTRPLVIAPWIVSADGAWETLPSSSIREGWFVALIENVVDLPKDWGASPYRFLRRDFGGIKEERIFQKTKTTKFQITTLDNSFFRDEQNNPVFWVWERLK